MGLLHSYHILTRDPPGPKSHQNEGLPIPTQPHPSHRVTLTRPMRLAEQSAQPAGPSVFPHMMPDCSCPREGKAALLIDTHSVIETPLISIHGRRDEHSGFLLVLSDRPTASVCTAPGLASPAVIHSRCLVSSDAQVRNSSRWIYFAGDASPAGETSLLHPGIAQIYSSVPDIGLQPIPKPLF